MRKSVTREHWGPPPTDSQCLRFQFRCTRQVTERKLYGGTDECTPCIQASNVTKTELLPTRRAPTGHRVQDGYAQLAHPTTKPYHNKTASGFSAPWHMHGELPLQDLSKALQSCLSQRVPTALTCSAWRFRVASSSDMPPDRKWMPGTEEGTVRRMVCTVYLATSWGLALGASKPGIQTAGTSPSAGWQYQLGMHRRQLHGVW